jgi:hypothetical protein
VEVAICKDEFGAMYFGDHAYLRSMDGNKAISVEMAAPEGAWLRLISGDKICPDGEMLRFSVNATWADEAPILYGYPRQLFAENIQNAKVSVTGETTCCRWPWRD